MTIRLMTPRRLASSLASMDSGEHQMRALRACVTCSRQHALSSHLWFSARCDRFCDPHKMTNKKLRNLLQEEAHIGEVLIHARFHGGDDDEIGYVTKAWVNLDTIDDTDLETKRNQMLVDYLNNIKRYAHLQAPRPVQQRQRATEHVSEEETQSV